MDYPNDNTTLRKNKHLNYEESMIIQIRLKDGFTSYKIAKELGRPINTIINEIRRGTTTQIKSGKTMEVYLADTGEAVYRKNRRNSCRSYKRLECSPFIEYATEKILNDKWSPNTCFGSALKTGKFERRQMICAKTLYNYFDLSLLKMKNSNLQLN